MLKIIKYFIPPIFLFLKRKIFPLKIEKKMWSGNYENWQQTASLCSGYDNDLILEKCKNALLKVKNGEAVYERDSVVFNEIQYSWGLLAGLQKAAIENENKLCVIDFGGSLGSTYYQNKTFLSNLQSLEWNIVEQAHFVDCGKESFEDQTLKFYHTIDECLLKHKPNVLLLSSVLQYLENPDEWIQLFLKYNFDYIILDRTAFVASENNLLTIQIVPESIYEASYPAWFFGKQFTESNFSNFELISTFPVTIDPENYLLNEKYIANWKGYIFKRK